TTPGSPARRRSGRAPPRAWCRRRRRAPGRCPRGRGRAARRRPRSRCGSLSLLDLPEARVVVVRVVAVAVLTGDDASGTAVVLARGGHGVLAVVAALLLGQDPLPVLEGDPVPVVGEGPAVVDQLQGLPALRRQLGGRDRRQPGVRGRPGRGAARGVG